MGDSSFNKKSNRPGRVEIILTLILYFIIGIMIVMGIILELNGFKDQIFSSISVILLLTVLIWHFFRYQLFPRNKT